MRAFLIVAVIAAACGGHQKGSAGGAGGPEVFAGARFVPAKPTYVLAASSFRTAQLALHDTVDILGMAVGAEVTQFSSLLQGTLGVDPIDPNATAQIGIDMDGPWLAFSEGVEPTFVIHLADPSAMTAFLDREKGKGLKVTSMIVDHVEVSTARLEEGFAVSWAIEKDWMWIHFADLSSELGAWFEHSHKASTGAAGAPAWTEAWEWASAKAMAQGQGQGQGLIGFANLRDAMAVVAQRGACAKQFDAVERVGLSIDTDGKKLDAHLVFDVGAGGTQTIGGSLIAPPPGWAGAVQGVPVAAEWNLDAAVVQKWSAPCFARQAGNIAELVDQMGVRAARGLVVQFDPDDKSGVGAVSLDLAHDRFIAAQLDQIPMRSRLEKDRTFGQYKGKHLSVPFVATVDYVLTDKVFVGAMGDGLLAKLGTGAAPSGMPVVASVDVVPAGLKQDVWQWLFEQIDAPSPERLAQRLQEWQQLHVGARLDGTSLVIEAAGTRR